MGSTNTFNCPNCGYSCNVSGGRDRGMITFTNTYLCHDCKEVDDICIGRVESIEGQRKNVFFPVEEICCRYCNGRNIEDWGRSSSNLKNTCPKCSKDMKVGFGIVMWD